MKWSSTIKTFWKQRIFFQYLPEFSPSFIFLCLFFRFFFFFWRRDQWRKGLLSVKLQKRIRFQLKYNKETKSAFHRVHWHWRAAKGYSIGCKYRYLYKTIVLGFLEAKSISVARLLRKKVDGSRKLNTKCRDSDEFLREHSTNTIYLVEGSIKTRPLFWLSTNQIFAHRSPKFPFFFFCFQQRTYNSFSLCKTTAPRMKYIK